MDITMLNTCLATGEVDRPGLFPHLERLKTSPYSFNIDFGLAQLPLEPGMLLIRGPRQYGKSTWLEEKLRSTIIEFGPATAFYLNGDNIPNGDSLEKEILNVVPAYAKHASVKRLFIDEITAIKNWEVVLKRLIDRGELEGVLIITTGSRAMDLRRGAEKLPGRKGKLEKTAYWFTPISYREFKRVCGNDLGDKTLPAYILSGGSPIACSELATTGRIPEYVIQLVRDWIEGEITGAGRQRGPLMNIFTVLNQMGGTAIGQSKLAREAMMANNTVASGYIELLQDLGCVTPCYRWDQHKKMMIFRKECKYHFTNLLAAIAYHPSQPRLIEDFLTLPSETQGIFYEWVLAQEIMRRDAIYKNKILEPLAFWQNQNHELDFVTSPNHYIEVKRGQTCALEFTWFIKQFPGASLTVISRDEFDSEHITGITLENFLLDGEKI